MIDPLLEIGPHVTALPIVHGSGDFAWEIRRLMAIHEFDCVAVPIPASFQTAVESAILNLPTPSVVVQRDRKEFQTDWKPESPAEFSEFNEDDDSSDDFDFDDQQDDEPGLSYVPIDPCQPVIAALRTAMGEHIPRKFIDMGNWPFSPSFTDVTRCIRVKKTPDPSVRCRCVTAHRALGRSAVDSPHALHGVAIEGVVS